MGSDLPFSCQCGAVTGVVTEASPADGDHVVCHCTDCRALTRYLGHSERVLDRNGGTELYQSRCARLRIASGLDHLAALHLTDKPLMRWYAACCRSPLFNTWANGRVPFVTTHLSACNPDQVNAVLGPPKGHLFLREALGDTGGLHELTFMGLTWGYLKRAAKDTLSGDRRRCPLFDHDTLAPIVAPYRLSREERRALD